MMHVGCGSNILSTPLHSLLALTQDQENIYEANNDTREWKLQSRKAAGSVPLSDVNRSKSSHHEILKEISF